MLLIRWFVSRAFSPVFSCPKSGDTARAWVTSNIKAVFKKISRPQSWCESKIFLRENLLNTFRKFSWEDFAPALYPLCHTYSEPSRHEDSPGTTKYMPYIFKNWVKRNRPPLPPLVGSRSLLGLHLQDLVHKLNRLRISKYARCMI